jgi:hypothetical protein
MGHLNLIIGIFFDILDWFGIGMLPILGDIVDLASTAYWIHRLGPLGIASAAELVPLADVLPINIVLGYLADKQKV